MTNSVTFPVALGGDGKTYTDDADPETGLDGLGYTVRFIPCLEQAVIMGLSAKDNAEAAASFAAQCQTLRNAVSADRQAVANDRTHVNQQRNAVDAAAQEAAQSAASVDADQIVHKPGSGLPNQAGTAAALDVTTSPTDTTAGRVLRVRDFGVGSTDSGVPVVDANEDLASGFYYAPGSNAVNYPAGSAYRGFAVFNRRSSGGVYMTSRLHFGANTIYVRQGMSTNGVIDIDQELTLYSNENILGTVSQSGGVPTGAIIERGSNANGEYVKFADGTLICTRTVSGDELGATVFIANGNVFNTSVFSFDYPISFFGAPHATSVSGLRSNIWTTNDSGWGAIRLIAGVDYTGTFSSSRKMYLFAIGRWY